MEDKNGVWVRQTQEFKLKDRPTNRRWQAIDLKKAFGFMPEIIVIEKVQGAHDKFLVKALLTKEEIKKLEKEEKVKQEVAKAIKDLAKPVPPANGKEKG